MNRRALLAIAAGSTAILAGCLEPGSGDGTPTASETPTDDQPSGTPTEDGQATGTPTDPDGQIPTEPDDGTPTETETETSGSTPGEPRLVDREMEIQSVECGGSGDDHWEVDVGDGVVTVDGKIGGNNACYSARIASAAYDADEDVLRTEIESYDDSREDEGCADCIADVFYRATYTFEDGEPGEVEVQHDGRED